MRISDSESKKPLNVGISANYILTFDGFSSRFSYKSEPRRASPFANSTKRLGQQILKLAGFGKPYCRIKWIFSSICFPLKRLFSSHQILTMVPLASTRSTFSYAGERIATRQCSEARISRARLRDIARSMNPS
jgi:hypothetical protein